MGKELLSIGETSKLLGVSIDTLRRWDRKGKLLSIRFGVTGHRYYRKDDIDLFLSNLKIKLYNWAKSKITNEPDPKYYCYSNDIFRYRLEKMQKELQNIFDLKTDFSLITAITGEIGNNSFDHNLGNWPDIPGIFFGYDLAKRIIVLGDRGQGIFTTLKRVKPEIITDRQALVVAFNEFITGRAPEKRGNGLKFVKNIAINNPISFVLQTGTSQFEIKKNQITVTDIEDNFHGCISVIEF